MKKLLVLIFAAALLLSFAACGGGGGGASADPNCGHYDATTLEMMGFTMDVAEVFPDGFSIDLLDGGKAKFNYDGKSYNMKWTLDGTTFHAEGGGAELDGTLSAGVMQLSDVMSSGLEITLVNADAAGGEVPAPGAGGYDWWNGQWYGWRVIYEAGGGYEELVDNGYDVVANIKVDGDTGTVTIWDYDESEADAIVTAEVSFQSGLTDKGSMVSEGGEAFYEPLSKGSWVVDPGDDMVSAAGDMICIEGTNVDSDNSEDWFTYMIFLRPWGVDWSDLETVDDSNFPYNDMVPFHHEDWYKGQIPASSAGSTAAKQDTTPAIVPEPESGTILYGNGGDSEITIENNSSPCVVKLKDTSGADVIAFYVRANDTVTVGVPEINMYTYFASGNNWYGYEYLFGEETYYSMDDKPCDYYEYTKSYTLYPVANGNFTQTPINADSF